MSAVSHEKNKLRPKELMYIALDNFDLSFKQSEISRVIIMYNSGETLETIRKKIRPKQHKLEAEYEVFFLMLDLHYKGLIELENKGEMLSEYFTRDRKSG